MWHLDTTPWMTINIKLRATNRSASGFRGAELLLDHVEDDFQVFVGTGTFSVESETCCNNIAC